MMKRVLLTGSSGFIGSYFFRHYRSRYHIEPLSFSSDKIDTCSFKNIACVLHLGALVHRMDGAPEEAYLRVNRDKTVALAKRAKASGVGHFILMSTVKVYGEERDAPYTEATPCCALDAYGKSKQQAEIALKALEDETFTVSVIRTPVVYGEGVKANIYKLLQLVERHTWLPFGQIDNRRSMIYVGNLAHLIDRVITQKCNGVFLAADDAPVSMTGLLELIAGAMHKRIRLFPCRALKQLLKYLKPALYHRLYGNLYVDNSQTRQILELENLYTAREGVANMVQWYLEEKQ